jgi:acetyl esterase/lipase
MTTSSASFPDQSAHEHRIAGWVHSLTLRRIGSLVLLLALLVTIATFLLQARLNYPAILLDTASRAHSLLAQGWLVILLGFVGLLLAGGLVMVISLALASHLDEPKRWRVLLIGGASSVCWMLGALLGLLLIPLWGSAPVTLTQTLATLILVTAEIITPLGLSLWTLSASRQFRAYRVLGALGAIGLLLMIVRSLFWGLNALLPIEAGWYGTAGVLNVLALLGTSCWLLWLWLFGFRLRTRPMMAVIATPQAGKAGGDHVRVKRRRFLAFAFGLGVGLAGTAFVGARTGLTIANSPDGEGDAIPSEPSLIATQYFLLMWILFKFIYPIHNVAQLLSASYASTPPVPPPGVTIEQVDADGVQAQRVLVKGTGNHRWILHFHPGGFTRVGLTDNRAIVVRLAQAAGTNALYPDYRGTPADPFPAGLNDCVTAYRWLLSQGVAASQIALTGESAGANLVLATALALAEHGETLPGALIAVSPPTDLAMKGETMKTKAFVDPIMAGGLAQDAFALYTNHGVTDSRNPLASPLYANVQRLPPTLLLVGSEEALLSDSTRMADRLKAAGVEVKLEIWPGMWHDFIGSPDVIPEVRLATQHIATFIRRHVRA